MNARRSRIRVDDQFGDLCSPLYISPLYTTIACGGLIAGFKKLVLSIFAAANYILYAHRWNNRNVCTLCIHIKHAIKLSPVACVRARACDVLVFINPFGNFHKFVQTLCYCATMPPCCTARIAALIAESCRAVVCCRRRRTRRTQL